MPRHTLLKVRARPWHQVIPRVVEFNGHSFPLAVERGATDRMVEVNLLDGSLSLPPTPDTMDMYLQKVATTANIVKDNYAQMFNPS